MSPATEGGEQWPMRRVLPTKPTVRGREGEGGGGVLTLVRNNIPAAEIQNQVKLGVKLVLARTPVTVFNIYYYYYY